LDTHLVGGREENAIAMAKEGEAEATVDIAQVEDAVPVLGERSFMSYSQPGATRQQHLEIKPEEDWRSSWLNRFKGC